MTDLGTTKTSKQYVHQNELSEANFDLFLIVGIGVPAESSNANIRSPNDTSKLTELG